MFIPCCLTQTCMFGRSTSDTSWISSEVVLKRSVGLFLWFQLKARDVAGQALSFIQDLVAALLNFHSYTEQRVHIYPLDSSIEPISPLNQKVRTSTLGIRTASRKTSVPLRQPEKYRLKCVIPLST